MSTFIYLLCVFFAATLATLFYTLSLHDALPISPGRRTVRSKSEAGLEPPASWNQRQRAIMRGKTSGLKSSGFSIRSEEHTSELQSHSDLVCRLLLEKKNLTCNPI